jgi:HEPN domain-containing protein
MKQGNKRLKDIKELSVSISDIDFYEGLEEIISELEKVYNDFNTHSMNESVLYFEGQEIMLKEIIEYLKRIRR